MLYCANCDTYYDEAEVTYKDRVSKWCPICFRLGESPNSCILQVKERLNECKPTATQTKP